MIRKRKTYPKRENTLSSGCLMLFGLPFLSVGVGMLSWLVFDLWEWSQIRGWADVEASIVSCNLEVSHDSEGGTTYRAVAEYTYEWLGQTYTGDRVSLSAGADNLGSYQEDLHQTLERHRSESRPHPCRIDPASPDQSILEWSLRPGLVVFKGIFGLVFGGVGAGIIIAGFVGVRRRRARKHQEKSQPGQPWEWREEWNSGAIPSNSKSSFLAITLFAAIWNAIAWPLTIFLIGDSGASPARFLVLLFPLIGIGLIVAAVRGALRLAKYGRPVFDMTSVPASLGGPLGGYVVIPSTQPYPNGAKATLSCVNADRGNNDSSRADQELWSDELSIPSELIQQGDGETKIPILFGIPFDQPEASVDKDHSTIEWRLEIKADTPGVDLSEQFLLPVFRTEDSREDFSLDPSLREAFRIDSDELSDFRDPSHQVGHSPRGGVVIVQPRLRQPGTAIGVTLFGAAWAGVVIFLFGAGNPIFSLIFAAFGMLLVPIIFSLWFETRYLRIDEDEVGVGGGYLVVAPEEPIARSDIDRVEVVRSGSVGSTQLHRIELLTRGGQKKTLLSRVPGRSLADRIRARILETSTTSTG